MDGVMRLLRNKIIRIDAVCELTGLPRSQIYKEEAAGRFPKRRQLTARSVGWSLPEVVDWIETRPAASSGEGSRAGTA